MQNKTRKQSSFLCTIRIKTWFDFIKQTKMQLYVNVFEYKINKVFFYSIYKSGLNLDLV